MFVKSNHFRSIVQYLVTTCTADRPEFSPRAINSTSSALAQVPIARAALEYYLRENGIERRLKSVIERAVLYGRAYFWASWDPSAGPLYAPNGPDGLPNLEASQRAGDITCRALSPTQVASDTAREQDDHDWFVVRETVNRFDLVAQFASSGSEISKALKEEILGITAVERDIAGFGANTPTDDIERYHFYHRATHACPGGRYTIVLPTGGVLFDGDLPYDDLPVIPVSPADFLETGFGYSSIWDLIGLQEIYDSILSTLTTNVDAFGVQNIVAPEGSDISVETLRDGLNLIHYPPGTEKPSVLDLCQIRPELFAFRDLIKGDMETLPGVNSVARGEPNSSLKSGAALALVQNQALIFNSGLTASFTQLLESVGTVLIRILKRYAKIPRLAAIAGEFETEALREFKSDDLSMIDRVVVDRGNALSRTTAGKIQMAEWLLDKGLIKRPEQIFQVLETGRLDPTYKADRAQVQLIAQENEELKKGNLNLPVLFTDHPILHLQEHMAVLSSWDVRSNPEIAQATSAHVQKHLQVWRATDPNVLRALGYPIPMGEDGPDGPKPQKPKKGEPLPEAAGPTGPQGQPGKEPIHVPGQPAGIPGGPEGGAPRLPRMPTPPQVGQG